MHSYKKVQLANLNMGKLTASTACTLWLAQMNAHVTLCHILPSIIEATKELITHKGEFECNISSHLSYYGHHA